MGKSSVSNRKLEILFERGILAKGWSDLVDCCYYDNGSKQFKELICETYHGSGGWFRSLQIEKSELNVVFKKEWEYILYNYKAKIFILSSIKGGVGLYEVYYPLNIEQVKNYFEIGQKSLDELNRNIQNNDEVISKRYAQIK